ncbi:MAG: cation transporter [Proteobacteria bacterium]|nr:cation transporter [Pseudomonadota bacterium]
MLTTDSEWMKANQRKVQWVILLNIGIMILELVFGYVTRSMALLSDGWHMASHVGALSITYFTYALANSPQLKQNFVFGTGKFMALGGYTNSIVLAIVAIWMGIESASRIFNPEQISFREAIIVSCIGLAVNLMSALILGSSHEGHSHSHLQTDLKKCDHHSFDPNLKSAYFHVLADALTSIFAIAALLISQYLQSSNVDSAMGMVGSVLVLRWAVLLATETGWELLDGHSRKICRNELKTRIEALDAKVLQLKLWSVGPQSHACELILQSRELKGANFIRKHIQDHFKIEHIIIEEQLEPE